MHAILTMRLGRHHLSNATCLIRPHLFSTAWLVEYGYLILLHYSPLSRNSCVVQVVVDKWFPLIQGREAWPGPAPTSRVMHSWG